ncbi:hypothetical protein RJT34_20793 [Clitoria ternatea]|uniref:Uncharacterized protein n=1 Tax=Clitoria ternatea TaxID=43366 RepID=A0AAN9ITC6_CLITE
MGEVGRWVPNTRRRHSLAIGNLVYRGLLEPLQDVHAERGGLTGLLRPASLHDAVLAGSMLNVALNSLQATCILFHLVPIFGLGVLPLVLMLPTRGGILEGDGINGCYLVDPASSHMLVSKIKPCMCKRTTAKAFAKDVFINQERKLGARRRSDTVLVSTINDADQGSADVTFRTPLAPYEKSKSLGSGGSMVARLKLKGIDGRAPPGVEPAA